MSPDDLVVGKTYRFDCTVTDGSTLCVLGRYTKSSIELGFMWFYFEMGYGEIPYAYQDLNNLRQVEDMVT